MSRTLQARIEDIATEVRAETGVPGIALALEYEGRRYFASAGVVRAGEEASLPREARFDVSCLMKFMLSVTALRLAARGDIALDSDIERILPELAGEKPRGIHLIHLMSHASGYHGLDITDMRVRWASKWEDFTARFRSARQLFGAGDVFNYEHSEHVILGEALRRMTGRAPMDLVRTHVLEPAGVTLYPADGHALRVASHAYSRAAAGYAPVALPGFGPFWDMSLPNLTIALDDVVSAVAGAVTDTGLMARMSAPMISLPEMAVSGVRAERPPGAFSAACGLYDGGVLGHNGSMFGQTCGFRADPATGTVAAVGVNAWSPHARDTVLRRVLEETGGRVSTPPEAPAKPAYGRNFILGGMTPEDLEGRYTGSYLGEARVTREGRGLRCVVGPAGNRQTGFMIATENGESFAIESQMPVSVCFRKTADGAVLHLGVHAYGRENA